MASKPKASEIRAAKKQLRAVMGVNGLALATSIAGYVGTVALLAMLKRRFRRLGFGRILPELIRIVVCALVCGGVAVFMNRLLPPVIGTGRVFIRLALCSGAALIAYFAACWIVGVKTLRTFTSDVLRRGRRS